MGAVVYGDPREGELLGNSYILESPGHVENLSVRDLEVLRNWQQEDLTTKAWGTMNLRDEVCREIVR
jgi:hypothetical protein